MLFTPTLSVTLFENIATQNGAKSRIGGTVNMLIVNRLGSGASPC